GLNGVVENSGGAVANGVLQYPDPIAVGRRYESEKIQG
ncbi:hypothetical protein A2U01_0116212, partial [Trifolium medium]|nr:hypothetical protein [Trifolium medium]